MLSRLALAMKAIDPKPPIWFSIRSLKVTLLLQLFSNMLANWIGGAQQTGLANAGHVTVTLLLLLTVSCVCTSNTPAAAPPCGTDGEFVLN